MKFRFHPEALQEYENSALYYASVSPLVARRFVEEIEKTIRRIRRQPTACVTVGEDVRRCLVKRFPFGIYYTIESDHLLIVAVMHLSRRPEYWKDRVV